MTTTSTSWTIGNNTRSLANTNSQFTDPLSSFCKTEKKLTGRHDQHHAHSNHINKKKQQANVFNWLSYKSAEIIHITLIQVVLSVWEESCFSELLYVTMECLSGASRQTYKILCDNLPYAYILVLYGCALNIVNITHQLPR